MYNQTITEIHETFNNAGEKLLKNALEILNADGTSIAEKSERLKKAGFTKSIEVQKWDKTKITHELAKLIQHYQVHYPNNKFITEDQVKLICRKYNLVCAPTERYTGFVPETKLKLIESFSLNVGDAVADTIKIKKAWNTGTWKPDFMFKSIGAKVLHDRIGLEFIPVDHPLLYWSYSGKLFGVKSHVKSSDTQGYVEEFTRYDHSTLMICAPKKDMDLKGLQKVGGVFQSFTTVHIPDPVVLKPCKGGFLIVAAWGDEASDEIVVNPTHN